MLMEDDGERPAPSTDLPTRNGTGHERDQTGIDRGGGGGGMDAVVPESMAIDRPPRGDDDIIVIAAEALRDDDCDGNIGDVDGRIAMNA